MRTGRRFTTSSPGIGCKPIGRTWTNRNANGKPQLSYVWTAHTSLTIQRAQYMLYNRMLQYIALPISEEPPHATRTPYEDVENLARACLPFVESGIEFLPITIG